MIKKQIFKYKKIIAFIAGIVIFILLSITFFLYSVKGFKSDFKKNKNLRGLEMTTIVSPPEKIPFYVRAMIWIADKKAKKEMLPARLLSWSSRIGIGSGLLELLIEDGVAKIINKRLIKLLRLQVSFIVPSAFAIDINSVNYKDFNITDDEIKGLQGIKKIEFIKSFSKREKLALIYARQLSKTPIVLDKKLLSKIQKEFKPNEIIAIASLTAKVNYWARLVEALKIPPAGFADGYDVINTKKYKTVK